MLHVFSRLIDRLSNFFAARKGLLPILGMLLIVVNFILRHLSSGWLADSDLFLHLGTLIALLGFLLAWAL
ncbi:hypothetical protein ADN00_00955 [Ornatilinea apprima]|uniref:Uncharacterized protein n=1 Tax=Ornatilinea apprima TaxID=1134406 RepID=A0A0N8GPK1_9CHLR|nr:hypothetical protein [Ornatilinea apprima]KPL81122.1 hypothetical protein ADN00_00955 [Ornatilinea apprima]